MNKSKLLSMEYSELAKTVGFRPSKKIPVSVLQQKLKMMQMVLAFIEGVEDLDMPDGWKNRLNGV